MGTLDEKITFQFGNCRQGGQHESPRGGCQVEIAKGKDTHRASEAGEAPHGSNHIASITAKAIELADDQPLWGTRPSMEPIMAANSGRSIAGTLALRR